MNKPQIDLAHKLVGELNICARAADTYVNASMAAVMRNAASLLQQMIDEYEAAEKPPPDNEPGPWAGTGRAGNGSDM